MGARTQWRLSHGLFSSNGIDEGTGLLLKTLASEIPLDSCASLLDIGCGIGIIGGALKKRFPQIAVTLQDRDALALHFTHQNFKLNKMEYERLVGDTALEDVCGGFDLIVSNIPAKAGEPVIRNTIKRLPSYLNQNGVAAVVVISALKDTVSTAIITSGYAIKYQEHTPRYTVFHFVTKDGRQPSEPEASGLTPYFRGEAAVNEDGISYRLSTVYNIDEFDTVSYATHTLFSVLKRTAVAAPVGVYNPGQGHAPVFLAKKAGKKAAPISLFSRDILSLKTSAYNLAASSFESKQVHLPFPDISGCEASSLGYLCVFPEKIPGVPPDEYWTFTVHSLAKSGFVSFSAPSAHIHQITKSKPRGFILKSSVKYRGSRTVLFQKG